MGPSSPISWKTNLPLKTLLSQGDPELWEQSVIKYSYLWETGPTSKKHGQHKMIDEGNHDVRSHVKLCEVILKKKKAAAI